MKPAKQLLLTILVAALLVAGAAFEDARLRAEMKELRQELNSAQSEVFDLEYRLSQAESELQSTRGAINDLDQRIGDVEAIVF